MFYTSSNQPVCSCPLWMVAALCQQRTPLSGSKCFIKVISQIFSILTLKRQFPNHAHVLQSITVSEPPHCKDRAIRPVWYSLCCNTFTTPFLENVTDNYNHITLFLHLYRPVSLVQHHCNPECKCVFLMRGL